MGMKFPLAVLTLSLAVACASTRLPKPAPIATDRVVPSDVIDLRGIWHGNDLDPKGAAERGLDPAQIVTPRKITNVNPKYPSAAREARVTGTVTIECIVEISGETTRCAVTGGPGPLRDAALVAVRSWRWHPLTVSSAPKRALAQFTVSYLLGNYGP